MPGDGDSKTMSHEAVEIHEKHIRGLQEKSPSLEVHASMPHDFYYAPSIYQLERRAVFSHRWFLLSHQARHRDVGDYVQHDMAGYNFVVVRNKLGNLVGFHNVCRHRAFPVVQPSSGNAKVFSCKFHGWTYNLDGQLTKAPRFTPDTVPSWTSSLVHLFPVHIHVDHNGFVYANLDASETPSVSWESQYSDMDRQAILENSGIDWSLVEYDFTWSKEGNYNWKVMQDNFNECYHCLTTHPDVAKTTELENYYVKPSQSGGYISHFSEPKRSVYQSSSFDAKRFQGRSATYVFPGGHFSPNPGTGFMHLMRSIPLSSTKTRQEYDVYKLNTPGASPEAHERMVAFYQKVVDEDFALCEAVQRNLERGVWEQGPLHPFYEEGVRSFQETLLGVLRNHVAKEKDQGSVIWPASRGNTKASTTLVSAGGAAVSAGTKLCTRVSECEVEMSRELQW